MCNVLSYLVCMYILCCAGFLVNSGRVEQPWWIARVGVGIRRHPVWGAEGVLKNPMVTKSSSC